LNAPCFETGFTLTSLGRNKIKYKLLRGSLGYRKMPTISERQQLIQSILIGAEDDLDVFTHYDPDDENLLNIADSEPSSDSDTGSSSSTSSESSLSSKSGSSSSLSIAASRDDDTDEELANILARTADSLQTIAETRILNPHDVAKCSQLDLVLVEFKTDDPKRFRQNLRVSPSTFDSLLKMIERHLVFTNNSYRSQVPVNAQLAITLYRLGHNGNTASVDAIAQWAGLSAGTIVNCTRRVMVAFLALHDTAIRWPSDEEKEEAKEWVESVSCHAWRDGFCMVDGTLVPLFEKPGHHGEAYFDRKSNYSLNVQVSTLCNPQL
jgi:hypothetical protein